MKKTLCFLAVALVLGLGGSAVVADGTDELFPPNAKPGQCYTRVFVAPTYKTVTEQVQVREASSRIEVVPATFRSDSETVLVSEASVRLEVVPAVYGWVEERILLKPESKRMVEVPAVHEQVSERILVKAAHTVWKEGRGPIEKVDNSTGEIMCLVEVPAEYKTVTKRVLKTPARTREEVIPAEYKTIKRKVVTKPATTREVEIPAKYDTVTVRKLATEPTTREIEIPAEFSNVTRREQVNEGRMAWTEILCETNTTPGVVSKIQRALSASGHNPGRIDGVLGRDTMAAVASYQRAKGLPSGGLTVATLKSLGVL